MLGKCVCVCGGGGGGVISDDIGNSPDHRNLIRAAAGWRVGSHH